MKKMKKTQKYVSALGSVLLLGVLSVSACYYWIPDSGECQPSNFGYGDCGCDNHNLCFNGNTAGPMMDSAWDDFGNGGGTDATVESEPPRDCVYSLFGTDCDGDYWSLPVTNHNSLLAGY